MMHVGARRGVVTSAVAHAVTRAVTRTGAGTLAVAAGVALAYAAPPARSAVLTAGEYHLAVTAPTVTVSAAPGAPVKSAFTYALKVRSTTLLPAAQRVGSQVQVVGALAPASGGSTVGALHGLATVVAVENGRRDIRDERVRLELPTGEILAESIASAPRDRLPDVALIMPVVGGTGAFRGARGTVTVIPAGEKYIVAVDLRTVSRVEKVRLGMDPATQSRVSVDTPTGPRWTITRVAAVRGGGSFTAVSSSIGRVAAGLRYEVEVGVVTPRGTLQLRGTAIEGRDTAPRRATYAILGGTGIYAGMRGQAEWSLAESGSRLDLDLVKVVGGAAEDLEWVESGTTTTSVIGAGTAMLSGVGALSGRAGKARIKGDIVIYLRTADGAEVTAVEHDLPGGTLLLAGVTAVTDDPVVRPIVGGTGEYAGAIGTSTMIKVRDGVYRKTVSIWR